MKILNLYAGIGGNRKFWQGHDVVAVESQEYIADAYKKRLVDKLETNRAGWISAGMPDEFIAGYKTAVTPVEATN